VAEETKIAEALRISLVGLTDGKKALRTDRDFDPLFLKARFRCPTWIQLRPSIGLRSMLTILRGGLQQKPDSSLLMTCGCQSAPHAMPTPSG
jgi:hypothetical protein